MKGLTELSFGENILKYKDEMLKDLAELVAIKSVSANGSEEPQRALKWMLDKAESFGLVTKNVGGKAGHAQYGSGGELCGVLTHLDVVPEGSGWDSDPFTLTVKDGRLFGRGVADDKGSALVALYCLRALKDAGVEPKNTIRTIFGTSEEIGMEDMEYYFKHEPLPDMSFTPDSDYGICRCEKGILQLEISSKLHDGTTLTEFHAGTVINAVPDAAYALLDCSENEDHQLLRLADAKPGKFEFKYTIDGMMIISKGKAAHAAHPNEGFNAATHLIDLLTSNFSHNVLGSVCAFIDSAIGVETNGNSMGIKMRDSASGALTLNVGTVDINAKKACVTIDIRYPVTMDGVRILEQVQKRAKIENLDVKVLEHRRPLVIDEHAPIMQILKDSYKEIMHEDATVYATGGGTYARTLGGKGVAFGPVFSGDNCKLHDANESMDCDNFFKHAQICLEAMYRMVTNS